MCTWGMPTSWQAPLAGRLASILDDPRHYPLFNFELQLPAHSHTHFLRHQQWRHLSTDCLEGAVAKATRSLAFPPPNKLLFVALAKQQNPTKDRDELLCPNQPRTSTHNCDGNRNPCLHRPHGVQVVANETSRTVSARVPEPPIRSRFKTVVLWIHGTIAPKCRVAYQALHPRNTPIIYPPNTNRV